MGFRVLGLGLRVLGLGLRVRVRRESFWDLRFGAKVRDLGLARLRAKLGLGFRV